MGKQACCHFKWKVFGKVKREYFPEKFSLIVAMKTATKSETFPVEILGINSCADEKNSQ
jgi:hypothetical protein